MRRNYNQYIKNEDLDWKWDFDPKKKIHKLTLTHTQTGKTISGEVGDGRTNRTPLAERKKELWDTLLEKLEEQVFGA